MSIKSVGVCLKPDQPQAADAVNKLVRWLQERQIEVCVDAGCPESAAAPALSLEELVDRADLLVVLGGDGTLLSVARAMGTRATPILGVNLGRLGFLTEINQDELIPALDRALDGDLNVSSRMRLDVSVLRGEEQRAHFLALNDAVITNSALSRMIEVEAYADGLKVTTYYADGLIVATPTGSTAYSLSAGGPLLLPGLEAIALTPICPHSLTQRPLVFPVGVEIEMRVSARSGEVVLTVDGQEGLAVQETDRIMLRRSPHPVGIVASPFRNRYEILHQKLRWGER